MCLLPLLQNLPSSTVCPPLRKLRQNFHKQALPLLLLLYEAHAFRGDPGAAGSRRGQLPGAWPPHAFLRRPVTRALRQSLHLALSSARGRHGSITTTGTESLCGCGDTACLMEKGMARGDVTAGLRPSTQHGVGARVGSANSGFSPSVTKQRPCLKRTCPLPPSLLTMLPGLLSSASIRINDLAVLWSPVNRLSPSRRRAQGSGAQVRV